ncbi:hypothetical protein HS088_TW14G00543 [Tripterygium wilfordii]|uniref:Fe2OG dioxygenase domain-containing protein n=1 Tax=Tripterygium wilfordii TaxID=458696 RepID=A0A7J7CQR7_TRIWF|nr:S-norcoclaurine synthase 1-like [Tripterygium wilfordii]KAF5736401.1 hypothetical protein HS088_TW14G00543 [Tripterygium wilfordii]
MYESYDSHFLSFSFIFSLTKHLVILSEAMVEVQSLQVPNVQELATQGLKSVPTRYVRDDIDGINPIPSHQTLGVPLIDMTKLVNPDDQEIELQRFYAACKDWGVFQIKNHGIPDESLRNMRNQVREFFNLPLQEKKRCAQRPGGLEGYGQVFVTSQDQKLEWNDMLFLKTLPTQIRSLDLWPQNPPRFRETLEDYSENMKRVGVSLMKLMARGLQLEEEKLSDPFENGLYEVKMICYPPCPEPDRVLGIKSHSDICGITILLDCGETPGLQALKDGNWVPVEPIEGAAVVIVGNILEIMSNGVYKSSEHRAVVNKLKERQSVVTFCYPDSSVKIGPVEQLTTDHARTPALYKTVTFEEYCKIFFDRVLSKGEFDGSFIDALKM